MEHLLSGHDFITPHSSSLLVVLKNHVTRNVTTELDSNVYPYLMYFFWFRGQVGKLVGHPPNTHITDLLTNARQWDGAIHETSRKTNRRATNKPTPPTRLEFITRKSIHHSTLLPVTRMAPRKEHHAPVETAWRPTYGLVRPE